jgi:hypothetical protein
MYEYFLNPSLEAYYELFEANICFVIFYSYIAGFKEAISVEPCDTWRNRILLVWNLARPPPDCDWYEPDFDDRKPSGWTL